MLASFRKTPVSELNSKCFEDLKSRVQNLKLDEYMYKYCDRMLYSEANEDRCMLGLQHIIGQVEEGECQDSVLKVSSFRYKDSPVYTICPVSRNKAWITHIWAADRVKNTFWQNKRLYSLKILKLKNER